MDNSVRIVLLVLLLVHSSKPAISEKVHSYLCKSPQLLELGKNGSVQCLFNNNFNGVHWFNSTNVVDDKPIISLQGSRKYGSGYLTREYDIRNDGSLIIHNVSLLHELTFAVVVLTPHYTLVAREVQVQVIVKPAVLFPVISTCSHEERICFSKLHLINSFTCTMGNSRPPVSVTLKVRTLYGDKSITGPYKNKTMIAFTPHIDTDDMWMSSSLVLFVCQVESNPFNNMLKHQTSLLLLQNNAEYLKDSPIVTVVFNKDGQLLLECDYFEKGEIVWERSSSAEGIYETSLYASIGIEEFRIVLANDGISESNGSLAVSSANFLHEGFYRCISSNVMYETSRLYEAICIVPPSPPYPVIKGCNGTHTGCALYLDDNHGIVECSIHRIYPKVDLAISLTSEAHSDIITFYDKERKITEHGETFTVTLKYNVSVESTSTDQLTLQCTIHDPPYEQLDLTTSFEIHLSRDTVTSSASDESVHLDIGYHFGINLAAATIVVLLGIIIWRVYRKKQSKTNAQPIAPSPEEMILTDIDSGEQTVAGETAQLSPNGTEPADQLCANGILLLDDLVKTLRNYYEILYNDLRPVHIDQHEHFQVGKLFCDNNMQFLKTNKLTGNKIWEKIDSHHNVIASVKDTGTVVIIEGDVGYGKTMISLKLIQEWCENDEKSSLKGVELVIFFRVKELTEFSSLCDAIQSALLPKDSNISSTDIEKVLKKCQSVVIILDDYEKIHQKLDWLTDILKKKTLRHCKLVITTRSFEFVKSIVVSSKRFRLTAFSEETRKEYIHNYVGKQGKKFVEQVKTKLLENVVLNELCKIPLLLVAYIHLICEQNDNSDPESWISIFRYLLKCFELHHEYKAMHQADVLILCKAEALEKEKVFAKYLSTDQVQHATEHYEHFKRLGLFRHPISTESKEEVQCTILAELYAGKSTENIEKTELENFVKLLNLNQICFLPLLASYFNEHFLDTFINCYRDMEIPATWLKYELNRKLSTIRDSLTKFCSEHVDITTCEYPLLQRSKIELLKIASKYTIPIEDVSFTNCVDVELSTKDMLVITSGMEIPVLVTVKKITFEGKQTKLTNEEAKIMLMYCNHCTHLETVQFRRLTMPWSLKNCTKFLRKEITVLWNSADGKEFVLQMQSGLWNDLHFKNTLRKRKRSVVGRVKNKFGKSTNEVDDVDEVDTVPDTGSPIND